MSTFFISDLLLGCTEAFLEFSGRPFSSPEEHDGWIVEAVNDLAGEGDHLWVVGDLYHDTCDDPPGTARLMRPKLHFVVGNHDRQAVEAMRCRWGPVYGKPGSPFASVYDQASIVEQGVQLTLNHYPFAVTMPGGDYSVHGHIHAGDYSGVAWPRAAGVRRR